jgi:hypothetical protein
VKMDKRGEGGAEIRQGGVASDDSGEEREG